MTDQKKQTKENDQSGIDKKSDELKKVDIPVTISEKFAAKVINEFAGNLGTPSLSLFQKRLIQNYFMSVDSALKTAEERRLKKSEKYRDQLPVTWMNINMESLAINVVACAKVGYDPALPNHINVIPFKNNKTNKYDIVFIEGYRGRELKAKKYGFDIPDQVIVELVYSGDKFKPIKKDFENQIETYEFKISPNPFDRGEIIGGFYYHSFKENPEKNKLMFYNINEIEKRKPEYASPEFWGGEKTSYDAEGNKKGKEKVEGWYSEMCWKTVYRIAYGAITIDSQKIDEDLMRVIENERNYEANHNIDYVLENSKLAISAGANKEEITLDVQAEVVPVKNGNGKEKKKPTQLEKPVQQEPEEIPLADAPGTEGALFDNTDEMARPGF